MLDDTINDVVPVTSEDLTKQAISTYRNALESHSDEDCARAFALAQKADKDNAEIQYIIGQCYRYGDGVGEDCLKAMQWYRKAAEQGNVDALFEIGDLYAENISDPFYEGFDETSSDDFIKWLSLALKSESPKARIGFAKVYVNCVYCCNHPELGLEKKVNKATDLVLIRIAANGGYSEAQYRLGLCYESGDGVPQDYVEALRWYHKATENGSEYYYAGKLGEVYKKGLGVEKNYDEAIKWYHKAVESSEIGETIMNLAEVYELAGRHQDSVRWYREAAEKIGNSYAQYKLGLMYWCGTGVPKDETAAIAWVRKAAEQGNSKAQDCLGFWYFDGRGLPQDFIEAYKWFKMAAGQGEVASQYYLGKMYHNGLGVGKDEAEAFKWFRILAVGNHIPAQYALGMMYYNGEGIERSYTEAAKWFAKSANGGEVDAQYMLGVLYENGDGVSEDIEKALFWYQKAAARGNEDAGKKLKKIFANKECSGLKTESKINNMTYADAEGIMMKELTDKDYELASEIAIKAIESNGLKDVVSQVDNPFLLSLYVPIANNRRKVVAAANEIFHGLGVLPVERTLKMGEGDDYCYMTVASDGDYYVLSFNHPKALSFTEGDEEYQYTIKYDHEQQEKEALEEEEVTHRLIAGIKVGRLKSKTPDGYLVLAGEFYDAIESGEKKIEYRDFTEYNVKRTIGLKTVRFNRGYGSKGKPPKQMRWEVKKVVLMDNDDNECDPFNVAEDFWPTTIAIHLGKRIG